MCRAWSDRMARIEKALLFTNIIGSLLIRSVEIPGSLHKVSNHDNNSLYFDSDSFSISAARRILFSSRARLYIRSSIVYFSIWR